MSRTRRVRDVMREVSTILLDRQHVRWRLTELAMWISAGQREIAIAKPTAAASRVVYTLQSGALQALPDGAASLLRVVRNVGTGTPPAGRSAITVASRDVMDAQVPDWHNPSTHTPQRAVIHALFDPADQTSWYCWPPNDGTGRVEVVVSIIPDDVTVPDASDKLWQYSTYLDIDDEYANALTDYVLYRAFSKDAQATGNAQRALGHRAAFDGALGMKSSGEAINPNTGP